MFGVVEGVIRTRFGYTGGKQPKPTYHNLGDHTESIQVDFDPKVISYRKLLRMFWDCHSVTSPAWMRQYMSAIWYHDEAQKKDIERSKEKCQKRINKNGREAQIETKIEPLTGWTNAEDYHQKFYLRKHENLVEVLACATEADLRESPIAARLNGYVASRGSTEQLDREIESFALNEESKEYLCKIVGAKKRGFFCSG